MRLTLTILSLIMAFQLSARENKKPGRSHTNFYKDAKVETDEYLIEITDAIAEEEFSKLKIKITNKTNDYLLFDGSKCVFVFEFGEFSPKERDIIIEPNDSESKVLNVADDTRFHVDNYSLKVDGLQRVASTGKTFEAPDFQLPPSINDFKAGPFDVSLKKLKKETDNTVAQFEAIYTGSEIGLIDPTRIGVRIEGDQEFANVRRDYKTQLLERGGDDKFSAHFQIPAKITDMQFAMMWILWRSTFQESMKVPIAPTIIELTLDVGKTEAEN